MRAAGAECAQIARDALSAENKGKNNNNTMRLRANQPPERKNPGSEQPHVTHHGHGRHK